MHRITVLLAFLSTSLFLLGQPTLDPNIVIPYLGQQFNIQVDTSYNPGSVGANQTWDYTFLSNDLNYVQEVVSPSSTPAAADFPDATFAISSLNSVYEYYKRDGGKMSRLGNYSNPILVKCGSPAELLRFPMTFQDSYQGHYSCEITATGSPLTYYREVDYTVEAVGYGTLQMPGRSFNDVIQIKVNESLRDSAHFQGTDIISTGTTETYLYFSVDHQYYLLSTSESVYDGQATHSSQYQEPTTVNVEELTQPPSAKVYPNPSNSIAVVQLDLQSPSTVHLEVINGQGQLVYQNEYARLEAGPQELLLPTDNWSAGMYWIKIDSDSEGIQLPLVLTD